VKHFLSQDSFSCINNPHYNKTLRSCQEKLRMVQEIKRPFDLISVPISQVELKINIFYFAFSLDK